MKKAPTLEEVKEYFKDAETVQDWNGDIGKVTFKKLELTIDKSIVQDFEGENWLVLVYRGEYAKILTYKTPTYTITKERILEIANKCTSHEFAMKEAFPEVFKKELEVGKWYKRGGATFKAITIPDKNKRFQVEGFDIFGKWMEDDNGCFTFQTGEEKEAAPQEVEAALFGEAKKRGYGIGCVISKLDGYHYGTYNNLVMTKEGFYMDKSDKSQPLCYNSNGYDTAILCNGIWATIIQPEKMTLSQIEKELGRKIELI